MSVTTWRDVRQGTIELQAVQNELGEESDTGFGLKTGARVALLLPNAYDRLIACRQALEARFGTQPDNALVFQECCKEGPLWYEDGFPVEWSADHYKRWTARVRRPARQVAAQAPDTEDWIAGLAFYELRHSAISTALHSTLVMTNDGMNLHTLAAYAGHDVQTLVATHTPGMSAMQLQRQLGISRYETAWLILQKLRRAMVAPEHEPSTREDATAAGRRLTLGDAAVSLPTAV